MSSATSFAGALSEGRPEMTTRDWFEKLVGFSESDGYAAVQSRLTVETSSSPSTTNRL